MLDNNVIDVNFSHSQQSSLSDAPLVSECPAYDRAADILDYWDDALHAIGELALCCSDACHDDDPAQLGTLIEQVGLTPKTFFQLAKAGGNNFRVCRASALLPIEIPTLSLIGELSEEEFQAGVDQGVIRRDMEAADLALWQSRPANSNVREDIQAPPAMELTVKANTTLAGAVLFIGQVDSMKGLFSDLQIERVTSPVANSN